MNETGLDRRASQQQIKFSNLNLLLNLLNKNGPVSRARLSEMTELSPTTVSSLMEELIDKGLVMEMGPEETNGLGRKAIQLQIHPEGAFVVSIELVESGFLAGLYDLMCNCIAQSSIRLDNFDRLGERLANEVHGLIDGHIPSKSPPAGVCVAIPGLIDEETMRVVESTVLRIDPANPFADILKREFPCSTVLAGNESSFCAYLEAIDYANQGIRDLILVDIGAGVGSGIIIGGRIFSGASGIAGELGHMTIDINGPGCKCGSRGCLEAIAGVPALMESAQSAAVMSRDSLLNGLCGGDPSRLTLEMVALALERGDPLCVGVVSEEARYLAFGLNNAVNLLNPRAIVISGQIAALGEPFLDLLRKHLDEIAFRYNLGRLQVRFSSVKDDAAVEGAARYMLDRLFSGGAFINWLT